jgi:hypothetical protein
MIDNNILSISNALLKEKKDWEKVNSEQKKQFFFIFNRFFSKKYLDFSFLLNHNLTDKEVSMDLWYEFMKNKPYPKWFWSKSEIESTSELSDNDYNLLLKNLEIKKDELDFLIKNHNKEILEELTYFKKIKN